MSQEIIKFLTAGNVDDGKSTLIGRLLFDTNSLFLDQIEEVKNSTSKDFDQELDFSLFLDGLTSERSQKITIDVAYRYFSYLDKKFIIADSPGHEQYTRNMAVGASNSDIIIILIDATKKHQAVGVQTLRHSYIASLFGIKNVIVAVNKMDLVNYDYQIFDEIRKNYLEKTNSLDFEDVVFVPINARRGDNVVKKSDAIDWYQGKTLIEYLLETKPNNHLQQQVRLQIQNLVKHKDQRYYQAFLSSGTFKIDDELVVFPNKDKVKIKKIIHSAKDVKKAQSNQSIAISFDKEIDLDRGAVLCNLDNQAYFANHFIANLIWFSKDNFNLRNSQELLVNINHNYLRAKINKINYVIDVYDLINLGNARNYQAQEINLNQIANIEINLASQVAFDLFRNNKYTGSFLLIDNNTNETLGCGIIENFLKIQDPQKTKQDEFLFELSQLLKKYFGDKNIDFSI